MRLSNHRHEAYALGRAAGYSQTESAKRAGFPKTSAPNAGYRLERVEAIKGRVAELLAEVQPDASEVASRSWIMCNFAEVVRKGLHPDSLNLPSAVRALETLAKMGGYVDDRKLVDSRMIDLGTLDPEQLQELVAARLEELLPGARVRLEAIGAGVDDTELASEHMLSLASADEAA